MVSNSTARPSRSQRGKDNPQKEDIVAKSTKAAPQKTGAKKSKIVEVDSAENKTAKRPKREIKPTEKARLLAAEKNDSAKSSTSITANETSAQTRPIAASKAAVPTTKTTSEKPVKKPRNGSTPTNSTTARPKVDSAKSKANSSKSKTPNALEPAPIVRSSRSGTRKKETEEKPPEQRTRLLVKQIAKSVTQLTGNFTSKSTPSARTTSKAESKTKGKATPATTASSKTPQKAASKSSGKKSRKESVVPTTSGADTTFSGRIPIYRNATSLLVLEDEYAIQDDIYKIPVVPGEKPKAKPKRAPKRKLPAEKKKEMTSKRKKDCPPPILESKKPAEDEGDQPAMEDHPETDFDFEGDAGSVIVHDDDEVFLRVPSVETDKEAMKPSTSSSAAKAGYKTPSIPKRVATKSIQMGKVSTPRLDNQETATTPPSIEAKPTLQDEKKKCFGFDDEADEDEEVDRSRRTSSIGGVTLSDISPVKRSSMLPPSHYITLLASPSAHSMLSLTNGDVKNVSSRPHRFNIAIRRPGDRSCASTISSASMTSATKFKMAVPAFFDVTRQVAAADLGKVSTSKAPPTAANVPQTSTMAPTECRRQRSASSAENKENEAADSAVVDAPLPVVAEPRKKMVKSVFSHENKNSTKLDIESTDAPPATKKSKPLKKKEFQPKIYDVIGKQKQMKSGQTLREQTQPSFSDNDPELVGPFDSGSELEVSDDKPVETGDAVAANDEVVVTATTTKRPRMNRTYERKSFLEDKPQPRSKSPVKVNKKKVNAWETLHSTHFSEIDEFDLVFK